MKYKISLDGQSSEQTESNFCVAPVSWPEKTDGQMWGPKAWGSSPSAPPRRGEQLIDF